MLADKSEIRLDVLAVNGTLTLILGLALFYLQGMMTNFLFDIIASVSAFMLCAAAFLMVGIVDFWAAVSFGIKRLHDVMFYLLLGVAFAACGIFVAFGSPDAIQVLVVFTIVHGLASGVLGFAAAQKPTFSYFERIAFYSFATASVVVSGTIAGLAKNLDDRSSVGWIGAHLCLVGFKLLFLAGSFGYRRLHAVKMPSPSVS